MGQIYFGVDSQSGLWHSGISGDLPIVLLRADDLDTLASARRVIKAHTYWRMCGLAVDLVILAGGRAPYGTDLLRRLVALVDPDRVNKRGGVFVRSIDKLPDADRILLQAAARVVIDDDKHLLPRREPRPASRNSGRSPEVRVDSDNTASRSGSPNGVPEPTLIFGSGLGASRRTDASTSSRSPRRR